MSDNFLPRSYPRDQRRIPKPGDQFEKITRAWCPERTITERYERNWKQMVTYDWIDDYGCDWCRCITLQSFRQWAKGARVVHVAS